MEQTECFKTSVYKIQAPGNYPEENVRRVSSCSRMFRDKLLVPSSRVLLAYIS